MKKPAKKSLNYKHTALTDLAPMVRDAAAVPYDPEQECYVNPCRIGLCDGLYAIAEVAEHKDLEFPPWGYILVLRADKKPVFTVTGFEPLELKPGMLVEFNAHTTHKLDQPEDSILVWAPLDSDTPLPLDEAERKIIEHFMPDENFIKRRKKAA